MIKHIGVATSLVFAIGALSCEGISYYSDPVEKSEVAGVYYANFGPKEKDYIELMSDGSYIHHYTDDAGANYADTGRYEFIERRKQSYRLHLPAFIRRHVQIGGCYSSSAEAVVDSTSVDILLSYYRSGRKYVIDYCPLNRQVYTKTASREESE